MALTTAAAIKTMIESAGLNLAAHRDRATEAENPPYCTIIEAIADVPERLEDGGPNAPDGTYQVATETVQVDLWQTWRNADRSVAEDRTLAKKLVRALHGARPVVANQPPEFIFAVLVRNRIRLLEQDENLVHDALTLEVKRRL